MTLTNSLSHPCALGGATSPGWLPGMQYCFIMYVTLRK